MMIRMSQTTTKVIHDFVCLACNGQLEVHGRFIRCTVCGAHQDKRQGLRTMPQTKG